MCVCVTSSGHLDVVCLLVSQGAEVGCKDKRGYTPLHTAASSGQIAVVRHLLNLAVEVGRTRTRTYVYKCGVHTRLHYKCSAVHTNIYTHTHTHTHTHTRIPIPLFLMARLHTFLYP